MFFLIQSKCCCAVSQLCLTLCDPMDCSTPGLPVPHHLLEFAQVHVHYTDDAILSWVFCLDSTSISSSDTLISLLIWTYLFLYTVSKKKTKTKTLISITLLLSCPVVLYSLRPHELQHTRPLSSFIISRSLPKFMLIALVMPSSHLILWCLLVLLPLIFPSIRNFSSKSSVHIKWPKYWSFSFSISPSSEYSGLISLKIDWLDLLAVQGTFRSLL